MSNKAGITFILICNLSTWFRTCRLNLLKNATEKVLKVATGRKYLHIYIGHLALFSMVHCKKQIIGEL